MKIKVDVIAIPGDKVIVTNYRRNNYPERAIVLTTNVSVNKDKSTSIQYHVILERVTTGRSKMYPEGGAPLFLTVGGDRIIKETKESKE